MTEHTSDWYSEMKKQVKEANTNIRIVADDAERLKKDTAFMQFIEDVRNEQIRLFTTSDANDIKQREEAHAILRALNKIEVQLDAAIAAKTLLDRQQ